MRVAVTGAGGQLGHALVRAARRRGVPVAAFGKQDLDITDPDSIETALADIAGPGAVVINLAAYTRVDAAEAEPDAAFGVNASGVAALARACTRTRTPVLHISTEYVFDGAARHAYTESEPVSPINVYGRSKAAGEDALRRVLNQHLIVRTSWLFGERGNNFIAAMLRLARQQPEVPVVADVLGCPTAAAALADTLLTLAERAAAPGFSDWGTYHYCGRPVVSRADFARAIFAAAAQAGGCGARVKDVAAAEFPTVAPRPLRAVLDCARIERVLGIGQPDWQPHLESAVRELTRDSG